ncbi:MAG: anthranilate phosphoribosyltransferase [Planctomyces sp.]|jgi:anthranilate phosphoribosyltransferase
MHECLQTPLAQLLKRQDLTADQVNLCIGTIMDGHCDAIDIAAFLTAMAAKGVVASELVGAARAMRDRVSRIASSRSPLLDTCGTGGDQLHTFNISTATAIVAASCGVAVAKHGNRSVSSSSGSADVLEALEVHIGLTAEQAGNCLDATGIAFCFAPLLHGAMKHAAPIRKQLGFPTIFNFLGPLTNPAGAQFQLLGTSSNVRAELLATALKELGSTTAFVVCGNDELDEVCLWGPTVVYRVSSGEVRRIEWHPSDFDLPPCRVDQLRVKSAAESAATIRSVFSGETSPAASIVIANTAAALLAYGYCESLSDAVAAARNALTSGAAQQKLEQLIEWTRQYR